MRYIIKFRKGEQVRFIREESAVKRLPDLA